MAVAQRYAFDQALIGSSRERPTCWRAPLTQSLNLGPGWIQQQVAAYMHLVDPVKAQAVLTSAIGNNRGITRPRTGVDYDRLSGHFDQARRAAGLLHSRYNTPAANCWSGSTHCLMI
jgi:hypothetical protein